MDQTRLDSGRYGSDGAHVTLLGDPDHDLTFCCLSAGVMEHHANTRRFQKIADMLYSAI